MKKLLLLYFIILSVSDLLAQNFKLDLGGRQAIYELISSTAPKNGYEEQLVKPYWKKKNTDSWNISGSDYNYLPVLEKDKENWIKKLIKERKCTISNYLFDNSLLVLRYPSLDKEREEAYKKLTLEQQTKGLLNNKNNLLLFSAFLSNDAEFNVPLDLTTTIKNKFGLSATKVLTNTKLTLNESFSGCIALKFYDENSANPSGYYQGEMKNGLANGYGIFIKPYYVENAYLTVNSLNADRVIFYTRVGFWENGVFTEEQKATTKMDSAVDEISPFLNSVFAGRMKPRKELVAAEYKIDGLCPNLSDGFALTFNLIWEDTVAVSGEKSTYLCFKKVFDDFSDPQPQTDYINTDDTTKKRFPNSDKPILLNLADASAKDPKWDNATETLYDDYTLIRKSRWQKISKVCKYEIEYESGNEVSRTPIDWATERSCHVEVSIRNKRNAEWKLINDYIISEITDCDYHRSMVIGLSNRKENSIPIDSYDKSLDYAVKTIKIDHPDPVDDTSVSNFKIKANDKYNALIKRFATSNRYKTNINDKMAGAWYDPNSERIYLIDSSKSETILCLEKSNPKIYGDKGYNNGVQQLFIRYRNENSFVIEADFDYYSGSGLFLNMHQRNKPNKGTTIHESHDIAKSDGNAIHFEDGVYWERIVPGDAFTEKIEKAHKAINDQKDQKAKQLKSLPLPSAPLNLTLGQEYAGGIVIHIFQPEEKGYVKGEVHGLLVNSTDLSRVNWKDAIYICDALTLNNQTDWRLPNNEELYLINQNINLNGYEYWSSEPFGDNQAYRLTRRSGNGYVMMTSKAELCYVRAVRNF